MPTTNNQQDLLAILRIVGIYALVGSLWIYFSDSVLGLLVHEPKIMTRIAMYKGLLFIILTSTLLYLLITRLVAERRHAVEAMLSSEQRFRSYVENANDIIFTLSTSGVLTYVSPNWNDAFGYELEEVIGQPFGSFVHPDDLAECTDFLQRVFTSGQKQSGVEYRVVRKDGSFVWYAANGALVHDPDGKTITFIGIGRDINRNKQAEAEQEILQAQLNQAQRIESVGRLAGGVAHDFNNMLGVIIGHADMALDKIDSRHPLFTNLQEIMKAASRSADLTRQLLAFARKQTIEPKVIDLNAAVEGMLKILQRLIGENIGLTWKKGAEFLLVNMDPGQVDQVLANLCVNARDAISGVGTVTIETDHAVFDSAYCALHEGFIAGEFVLLSVNDSGCGMDKETQANIFEPFFTTKGLGQGTGLGLATVYGIVKQNNGFIDVRSEPGLGSTFKIFLPRHQGQTDQMPLENFATPPIRGNETILLVEDEQSILNMSQTILEKLGYTVLAANTPDKAIRLADKHAGKIHLLITDVIMPDMNGRDLAQWLLTRHADLKCLFMSGYTADVIARHGVLNTGLNFIQKPFTLQDIADKVRVVLDSKRVQETDDGHHTFETNHQKTL